MITKLLDLIHNHAAAQLDPSDRLLALIFGGETTFGKWSEWLLQDVPEEPPFGRAPLFKIPGRAGERLGVWCSIIDETIRYDRQAEKRALDRPA